MTERPEDAEKTRTPYGTQRQVGSGLYSVSAYVRLLPVILSHTSHYIDVFALPILLIYRSATAVTRPPYLSSRTPTPSSTSSPPAISKQAMKSPSPSSTHPCMKASLLRTLDAAVGLSWRGVGGSLVPVRGVSKRVRVPRRKDRRWMGRRLMMRRGGWTRKRWVVRTLKRRGAVGRVQRKLYLESIILRFTAKFL